MGIKNVFKKKEPTEDEIREHMALRGISTKSHTNSAGFGGREEKFGAFKQYAQDRARAKPGLQPVNPYANLNNGNAGNGGNPYANGGGDQQGNPYTNGGGNSNESPYSSSTNSSSTLNSGNSNPYGGAKQGNPYGQPSQNNQAAGQQQNPYQSSASSARQPQSTRTDPYGGRTARDNVQSSRTSTSRQYSRPPREADEESLDLNVIPSNTMFQSKRPVKKGAAGVSARDDESIDLNALSEEEDLNVEIDDELPQEQEVNSEDEEVEAIKQDIRFVKQESLASTRNTLRMAQEADASGTNTLGMLGSQSERLYNAEQNLNLADTQSQIAEQKVKQIERLNRSIFIPASGNPFNKKSRLRQQEQKQKTAKAQEKYLRDTNRRNMYESEQRIKQGITNNATSSELYQKYQGEKDLSNAQRYQFENDSEDDEIEKELASNLDQIALYSKKLKNSARTMGQEVDSQNTRLRKIEDDADRLDINIHLNNTRLSNIR